MKIALYGGSFNPPHLGHISAAKIVMKHLRPDRFIIIPDYLPPHKELSASAPSAEERMEMSRLAFGEIPGIEISDIEIRRQGRSYTVDTLTELRKIYPDDPFYLVIGSDMLLSFESWFRFEDIFRLCTLTAVSREKNDMPELARHAEHLRREYGANVILIDEPPLVLSSTEIREALQTGDASAYLSPAVCSYIRERKLYITRQN